MVDAILDRMADALADGDRVELRDFGTFTTKEVLGHRARNPRTGAIVTVVSKLGIVFKPGKAMRVRLNPSSAVHSVMAIRHTVRAS